MRKLVTIGWIFLLAASLYLYVFHGQLFEDTLKQWLLLSPVLSYGIFFLIGALRGFTLIPSTSLVVIGLLFFEPVPLFIVVLAGIVVSSVSVYYFAEFLRLDAYLETKHRPQMDRLRAWLGRYELPVIIAWSATPFLPTDLICYVCGTLRVDIKKFILGVFIGEAIICAAYIFFGGSLIRALQAMF